MKISMTSELKSGLCLLILPCTQVRHEEQEDKFLVITPTIVSTIDTTYNGIMMRDGSSGQRFLATTEKPEECRDNVS